MRRRAFIAGLGGAAAWPLAARAQQSERARKIGVLLALAEDDPEAVANIKAFEQGLNELGWTNGRNIQITYRFGAGVEERMRAFSSELVNLAPDLIVAHSASALIPLSRSTRTIPIVVANIGDLVSSGFVHSLAEPGGNITGFTSFEDAMGGKWLDLLLEVAPGTKRVMFVWNSASNLTNYVSSVETVAHARSLQLIMPDLSDEAEIGAAIDQFAREPGGGLVVPPGAFTAAHRGLIIAAAKRLRLPAVYPFRYFAQAGGLIAYGSDRQDIFRRSASYVDRILKGEKPGDLPIQQPIKFELVINLKTAKDLGLNIPESFLLRADEVIE